MKSFLDYLKEENNKKEKELVGDQKKLDINKNGKLDKFDFIALKNKKTKKEYVDDQGKLIEKPETKIVADYDGPDAKTPPGDKKAAPYKAANDNVKSPTVDVEKQGLGELGDNKLKYEPDTKADAEGKVIKTKTEQFLNKTKNMSLAEFATYMLDECGCGNVESEGLPFVTAYTTGKFQPHPPEAIKYVVVLANKNNNVLDNVVHEMKNSGILGKVLKALLEHPESYDELSNLFGDQNDGLSRCKLFVKSLNKCTNESVGSPIGFEDEMNYSRDKEDMEDMEDMEDSEDDMDSDYEDEDMEDSEDGMDSDYEDEDMEDSEDDMDSDYEDEDMEDSEDDMGSDYEDEDMEDSEDDMGSDDMRKSAAHYNLMRAMRGI